MAPDVPALLNALHEKGVLLAAASNFDKVLPESLESLGIAHHLRVCAASASVGVEKPCRIAASTP